MALLVLFMSHPASADLGKVTGYAAHTDGVKTVQGAVTVHCEKGDLVIQSYTSNGWKISSLPAGMSIVSERPSISLTGEDLGKHEVEVKEYGGELVLRAGHSEVRVDKATSALRFYDNGQLRLSEDKGIDNAGELKTISFSPQHEAAFYGGGYNGRWGNLDGQTLVMNNTQNYGWDQGLQGPNNICVPFVVSTSGYGILFEDHYINGRIHLSSTEGIHYESQSPTPISYVYVGSEDGSQSGVMKTYGRLTGRHELPPYWALGYITSRYGYHGEKETRNVIASLKTNKMPVSGIVLDLFWEGEKASGMGNLDWYKPMWPNPGKMLADLKKKGVHTIIITEPYFAEETTNYTPLLQKGLMADPECPNMGWVSDKKVGIIDFMNPGAMDWMWQFYEGRTNEGVEGWWLDLGEPEMISSGTIHTDGSTHEQAHNEFGMKWIESVWKKWKQTYPNQRPIFVPRSGSSGMQRYATFPWTGDIARSWSGLRCQVPALIHGGMSGLGYLSSDIGGFASGDESSGFVLNPELYLRWFQLGVFSPVLRTHGTYLPEPYHPEYDEYKSQLRALMNLRYKLLPYLYSAAWANTTCGTPITTPISFYTQEPAAVSGVDDEYLLGPNLLVAPILEEGQTGRKIILPQGEWVDPISGEVYDNSSTCAFDSPDLRMPVFVRRGSFTPLYTQSSFTSTDDIDHSALSVYYPLAREKAWSFSLYDDDKSSAEVSDRYEIITFGAEETQSAHVITIKTDCPAPYDGRPKSRQLTFKVPLCERKVVGVTSESLKVSHVQYDDVSSTLTFRAKLPARDGANEHRIVLRYAE